MAVGKEGLGGSMFKDKKSERATKNYARRSIFSLFLFGFAVCVASKNQFRD